MSLIILAFTRLPMKAREHPSPDDAIVWVRTGGAIGESENGAEAARIATEEAAHLARIEQERADLLKRWGVMLPETIDLLHSPHTLFSVDRTCVYQDKSMAVSELQEVACLDLDGFDCTSRKGDR